MHGALYRQMFLLPAKQSYLRRHAAVYLATALALVFSALEVGAQTPTLSTDVGNVPTLGSSNYVTATGTYQLAGSGTGLGGSTDAFHFAYYQAVCGDGQIIVRVASADALAQAALVLRGSLDADATSAAVSFGGGLIRYVHRPEQGTGSIVSDAASVNIPCWLKLVRNTGTVSGFASTDGQTWTSLGSDTLSLGTSTIYIGLAVSNGSSSNTTGAIASFDNVQSTFLPAGLALWLKADQGLIYDANGHISTWADQSGNSRDAAQTDSGRRPLYVSAANAANNNQPSVHFDGSSTRLDLPDTGCADNFTVFVVARANSTHEIDGESSSGISGEGGQRYLLGGYPWSDGAGSLLSMGTNGISVYEHAGDYIPPLAVYSGNVGADFVAVRMRYTAKQSQVFVDGVLAHTGLLSPQPRVHAPTTLGGMTYGYFPGDVAEMLVFDHSMSDAESAVVEAYLNSKYRYNVAPAAPTQLVVTPLSATQAVVSWQEASNHVSGYSVERQSAGGSWLVIATLGAGTTSYLDNGLSAGAAYSYRVTANNSQGSSPASVTATVTTNSSGGAGEAFPTSGMQLWLRADAGVSTDNTGTVSGWTDQIGSYLASQSTSTSKPALIGNEVNGMPAVRFDGSNDYLDTNFVGMGGQEATFFVVTKGTQYQSLLRFQANGGGDYLVYPWYSYQNFIDSADGGTGAGIACGLVAGEWNIGTATYKSGAAMATYHNGNLVASRAASGANLPTGMPFCLGRYPGGSEYLQADVAEVIIYNRALPDTEREAVEAYLNAKYAVVAPPGAPLILIGSAISASQTNLFWQPASTGGSALGFSVERKLTSGTDDFAEVATLDGGRVSAFIDNNLSQGVSYTYRVRAHNAAGYSNYSPAAMVAMASGSSPANLPSTDSLLLWLRPDAGIAKDSNNQVTAWSDASGHGNNATAPSGNQPSWAVGAINGQPVLHFDGASSYLQLPPGFNDFTQGMTALVVARPTNTGSWQRFFDIGNGAAVDNLYLARYGTGNDLAYAAFNGGGQATFLSSPGVLTLNTCQLLEVVHGISGTVTTYKNGKQAGQGGAASINNVVRSSGFIGKSNWGDALYQGDIAEVILFKHALTDAERQTWETYLNAKYQYSPPPPAPTQVQATSVSSTQAAISWVDAFQDITGYRIERQNADGSWSLIASLAAGATSYVATGLSPATQYTFRVTASNSTGDSPTVATAAVTTSLSGSEFPVDQLRLWLRADSGIITGSNGNVSQWLDRSGHNNNAQQTDVNRLPQLSANAVAGQPAVHFDGASTYLNLPDVMTGAGAGEMFVVVRSSSAAGSTSGFVRFGNQYYGEAYYPASNGHLCDSFGSSTNWDTGKPAADLTQFHLYDALSQPGEWTDRIDGVLHYTTGNNSVGFTTSPVLGYSNSCFAGDIAEILVFDHALNNAQREAVGFYLGSKYALVSSPGTPTSVSAKAVSSSQTALSWSQTASAGGVIYSIERKLIGGNFALVGEVNDATTFLDTGLTPGSSYVYRVRARSYAGQSDYSVEFNVSVPATGPGEAAMPVNGLRLWLAADAGISADGLGTTWADLSGRHNNAWQTSTNNRPSLVANAVNGKPAVHFDGDDSLSLPDVMSGATAGEMFLVVRSTAPANTTSGFVRFGNQYYGEAYYPTASGHLCDSFGSTTNWDTGPAGVNLGEFHLYNASSTSAEWTNRIDGVTRFTTVASGSTNTVGFASNPVLGYSNSYFAGDIAEIMVFDHALTGDEREAVGRYLNTRYALTTAPTAPAGVTAVAISGSQAALSWNPAVGSGSMVYTIERKVAGGSGGFVAVAQVVDANSYLDSGLMPDTSYIYRIVARNAAGGSDYSAEVSVDAPTLGDGEQALPVAGLRLWLKADAGVSGSNVGLWLDQSGRHNDAHQETTSAQPVLAAGAINGRPAVHFDGNDSLALVPGMLSDATAGEMFLVVRSTAPANTTSGFVRFGNQYYGEAYYPTASGHLCDSFGSTTNWDTGPAGVNLSEFHLYNASSTSAEWTNRIDGVTRFTTVASGSTNTVGFVGNPSLGYSWQNLQGDIAEILVFDHALTGDEREAIERYVNTRYGILASAVPATPSLDTARAVSSTQVSLNWNDGQPVPSSATIYSVERAANGSGVFAVVTEVTNATSYLDADVDANTAYTYRVRARNAAGFSGYSAVAAVSTPAAGGASMPVNGLRLWLKADTGVSGANVGLWLDQSGRHNDAHQETTSAQPIFIPDARKGRPAIRFNGSNSLSLPDVMSEATAGEMFLVVRSTAPANTTSGFVRFGNQYYGEAYYPTASGHLCDSFGSTTNWDTGPAGVNLSEFHLYDASSTSAEWTNRIDGVTRFTTVASGSTNTVGFVGNPSLGYSWQNLQGDIAEILVFDHALSPSERDRMQWYLAAKYLLLDYDLDKDGLTYRQETALGTDPFKMDTNGDGISDGISLQLGINPTAMGGFNYQTPPVAPGSTGGGGSPPNNPSDHTPPVITLTAPADAVPLP